MNACGHRFVIRCFFPVLMFLSSLIPAAQAESREGYLYGKVILRNGNVYEGVLRWGDEEAFWDDLFNGNKARSFTDQRAVQISNMHDIEDALRENGRRRNRGFFDRLFDDSDRSPASHLFKCRFGDLRSVETRGSDRAVLTFKNGDELRIDGGSNDVSADIRVLDPEAGEMTIPWRNVDRIEFFGGPEHLKKTFGKPLYGEVETRGGTFTGFIQWDEDECLSSDKLDGETEDGDLSIPFGEIREIENAGRGARVTVRSGRQWFMTGSNDVNRDNRGIVVKDPRFGRVVVGWRDFDRVRFHDEAPGSGPSYDAFPEPRRIQGKVNTGREPLLAGELIYDLDEIFDFELLDGKDGDIEYQIPFRMIRTVIPRGRYGSDIVLENGEKRELEDSRDVDRDNDGVIVVDKDRNGVWIRWMDIREINLD